MIIITTIITITIDGEFFEQATERHFFVLRRRVEMVDEVTLVGELRGEVGRGRGARVVAAAAGTRAHRHVLAPLDLEQERLGGELLGPLGQMLVDLGGAFEQLVGGGGGARAPLDQRVVVDRLVVAVDAALLQDGVDDVVDGGLLRDARHPLLLVVHPDRYFGHVRRRRGRR